MPRKKERIRRKVVVGHDPSGKAVVKWAQGYTNKEVETRKQELIRGFVTGATEKQADMQYRYFVQRWYDVYKKPKLSASSRQNYSGIINNHILPYIGDKQLRAISAFDLQEILNRLSGRGRSTVGYAQSILAASFMHAYTSGCIDRNPALGLDRPATTHRELRALTAAETAAVLHVGATHPRGLLLLLLYYTGMRRGEALGLQWGDIDFDKRTISVKRDVDHVTGAIGTVKTPAALRTIPIPQKLYDVLRPLRGLPSVHIIQAPSSGSFLCEATYKRTWQSLMSTMFGFDSSIESRVVTSRKVKVENEKKWKKEDVFGSILTAHYFRRNYASVLYDAGVDVLTAQKILGHTDPKTTISIYTHLSTSREQRDMQRVCDAFDRLSGTKQG